MEEGEAIELIWQDFATNMIVPDLDLLGVLAAAPIQPQQLERRSNDRVDRIPVFKVKIVDSLAKNLGFVIRLDTQPLSCVQPTQPLLQLFQDRFVLARPPLPKPLASP
jgi:hypothetical protein